MNKIILAFLGMLILLGSASASFAGDPAAIQCLRNQALTRAYDNPVIRMSCFKGQPVWFLESWTHDGRTIKSSNPSRLGFNNSEIKMCGNPCK